MPTPVAAAAAAAAASAAAHRRTGRPRRAARSRKCCTRSSRAPRWPPRSASSSSATDAGTAPRRARACAKCWPEVGTTLSLSLSLSLFLILVLDSSRCSETDSINGRSNERSEKWLVTHKETSEELGKEVSEGGRGGLGGGGTRETLKGAEREVKKVHQQTIEGYLIGRSIPTDRLGEIRVCGALFFVFCFCFWSETKKKCLENNNNNGDNEDPNVPCTYHNTVKQFSVIERRPSIKPENKKWGGKAKARQKRAPVIKKWFLESR